MNVSNAFRLISNIRLYSMDEGKVQGGREDLDKGEDLGLGLKWG